MKILVVDDDKDIAFMIKMALERKGHEVTAAFSGQLALNAIKDQAPDLMIVDLTMPDMDGWRLSMKVREEPACKDLPIIVLSGLLVDEEAKPAANEPYSLLMAKPFDIIKLCEKVEELSR